MYIAKNKILWFIVCTILECKQEYQNTFCKRSRKTFWIQWRLEGCIFWLWFVHQSAILIVHKYIFLPLVASPTKTPHIIFQTSFLQRVNKRFRAVLDNVRLPKCAQYALIVLYASLTTWGRGSLSWVQFWFQYSLEIFATETWFELWNGCRKRFGCVWSGKA